MNETPDEDLARAAALGNASAFEALLKRYSKPLLLFCRHVLRDDAAAEDAVQETFLRLHLQLPRYDPSKRLSSWIYAIAHNLCRDSLRRRGRERQVDGFESAPVERPPGLCSSEASIPPSGKLTAPTLASTSYYIR